MLFKNLYKPFLILALPLFACAPFAAVGGKPARIEDATPYPTFSVTPLPTRPLYKPGEQVEYIAQSGDTLPALAARFNTTVDEIFTANPFIPRDATTMPPGMPMKIPVYYLPLWASPFQALPDHAFVNGPSLIGFDTSAFVSRTDGWLKNYRAYAGGAWRSGAGIVDYVASNFSVSPRLLLAILEYQAGALSRPDMPTDTYLLGFEREYYGTVYLQLVEAANTLNNGYYGWRIGNLTRFDLPDGSLFRPDPWENAASVAVKYYYSHMFYGQEFQDAAGSRGLAATYASLFGDPWLDPTPLIPGSLRQPDLVLPFQFGQMWSYTGGPHTGWGVGDPRVAVDFAPPSDKSGCFVAERKYYVIAVADGIVARSETGTVVLDLDGDGNERTGWIIYYLHIAAPDRVPLGLELKRGDPIGYPSCEGGHVTGTHVHIARKYNGEWISADGPLAFNMSGWIVRNGAIPYQGTMEKGSLLATASEVGDFYSQVRADYWP
jgi:murein DD-endopeptidase MepM/ murein hydrolase activator NlpD/LysM repeat protein